jgi:hypothetical protein
MWHLDSPREIRSDLVLPQVRKSPKEHSIADFAIECSLRLPTLRYGLSLPSRFDDVVLIHFLPRKGDLSERRDGPLEPPAIVRLQMMADYLCKKSANPRSFLVLSAQREWVRLVGKFQMVGEPKIATVQKPDEVGFLFENASYLEGPELGRQCGELFLRAGKAVAHSSLNPGTATLRPNLLVQLVPYVRLTDACALRLALMIV